MYFSQPFYNQAPQQATSFDAVAPFADPFQDLASISIPVSVPAMLRYAEFFSVTNETLREAYQRIAAYFLTDIEVKGDLGEDEKEEQKDYLTDQARVMEFLCETGLSFLTYGNAFVSVFQHYTRYVACPACHAQYRFKEFASHKKYDFVWRAGIHGRCPACKFSGCFAGKDREPVDLPDEGRPIILKSWNPHDIRIEYNESTGQSSGFIWAIPADFRTEVRMGLNVSVLAETPWEWLMAAGNDENIMFDPEYVYHWREPHLAGLRFRGVGVPRSIINFRQLYYTQILRRMNEVLALGHVVPMRVISPANTASKSGMEEGDILKTAFLGDIRGRVNRMVANYRADPTSIHFSPIPLQMQSLGADARQLIPQDILNQAQEVLLNGVGCPVEFYRMNMTAQAAPVGLRLIKRYWSPFTGGLNRLLTFIGRRAQFLLSWQEAKYALTEVTVEDSVELAQLRMQAAQAGLLSRTTAAKQLDADFKAETRQKMLDNFTEQREQARFQKEMDAFTFGEQLANAGPMPGQPGGPGGLASGQGGGMMPPGGGGGDPSQQGGQPQAPGTPPGQDPLQGLVPQQGTRMDPQEYLGRADQTASYLLQLPEGQRFGVLAKIKDANPMFHKLVKGQLEERRSSMRSQGYQQMQQQAQQGEGQGGQ